MDLTLPLLTDTLSRYDGLAGRMERALVYRLAQAPRLWATLGVALDPKALHDERAADLLRCCHAVAITTGQGPRSLTSVLQAAEEARAKGVLTAARTAGIANLLDQTEQEGGLPPDDEIAAGVGEVVRRYKRREIADEIDKLIGEGKDLSKIGAKIDALEQIGRAVQPVRVVLDGTVWEHVAALRRAERLPTGIPDLDTALHGGTFRRSLLTWGGDTGVGKTAIMIHQACYCALRGMRIVYVPIEMTPEQTVVRVIACLTGSSIADVEQGKDEVKRQLERVTSHPCYGGIVIEGMPPGGTCGQLRQAIEEGVSRTPKFNGHVDAFFSDYGDRMSGKESDRNAYDAGRTIWDGQIGLAHDLDCWGVTGSQLKDLDGKKIPQVTDLADSRWKGRITSTCVLVWLPEDGDGARSYHLGKHRDGPAGAVIERVPSDFARARAAVVEFPTDRIELEAMTL